MNFQNYPFTFGVDPADFYEPMFAAAPTPSLNTTFQEFSYGKVSLTGDILIGPNDGWYTLPFNQEECNLTEFVDAQVWREGIDLIDPDVVFTNAGGAPRYAEIFFVIHREDGLCENEGNPGGRLGIRLIETDEGSYWAFIWIIKKDFNQFDITATSGFFEEYIHDMDNGHANGWTCDSIAAQTAYASCSDEYDDPYDVIWGGMAIRVRHAKRKWAGSSPPT